MPGSEKEYKYWGRLASTFHQDNFYVTGVKVNQMIRGWLVEQFNEGDTVLELGCGTGCYSEMVTGKDNVFDGVLMANLLHIVLAPMAVLMESHRILKDNGRIVIVDFTGYGMSFVNRPC